MKKIAACLIALCSCVAAFGQNQQKQTSLGPKLLAQCYYTSVDGGYDGENWALQDSVVFFYPRSRPIKFDYNQMSFTDAFSPSFATDFLWLEPVPTNMDSGAYPRLPFDSLHRYSLDAAGALYLSHCEYRHYNKDSLVDLITYYDFGPSGDTVSGSTQSINYQLGHFTDVASKYRDTLGNWQLYGRRKLGYNTLWRCTSDTLYWIDTSGVVGPYWVNTYIYNAQGYYWQKTNQLLDSYSVGQFSYANYLYTPAGQLGSVESKYVYNHHIEYIEFDSLMYDPKVPGYFTAWIYSYIVNGGYSTNTEAITADNLKDSMVDSYSNGNFVHAYKVKYNSSKLPLSRKGYKRGPIDIIDDYLIRWYYDQPDGVPAAPSESAPASWSLVPNPGSGTFYLSAPGAITDPDLKCRITDASGRDIPFEWTKAPGRYKIQLKGNIALGQYIVAVASREGATIFSGRIVIQ